MSTLGQVTLKEIFEMLDECAPGYTHKVHQHYICVRFNEKTYPSLPTGDKRRTNPPIEKGHVKRMARILGIIECAKRVLSL